MEQKIRFKLRPVRVIGYLALLVLDIFLYGVLHSYVLLLAMFMMLLFPAASVAGSAYLCNLLVPKLSVGQKKIAKGEEALFLLCLSHPAWCMALHCRLSFSVTNSFLGHALDFCADMPVTLHRENRLQLPIQALELGRLEASCSGLQLQDMMGLVIWEKPVSLSAEAYVLPRGSAAGEMDVTGLLSGAAEREESVNKGSDFAQVSDIREYIPGDRFRDIHWKLSAKQESLMVKERVAAAGSEMVFLLKLTADTAQTERILELAYRLGQDFMAQRMPVCFLCWKQSAFCFEEYRCASLGEMSAAYCGIFAVPLSERIHEEQIEHMRNCFPFLKSYLSIEEQDGMVRVKRREND